MKIGILQCGRTPEHLVAEHGDYNTMFERLLADQGFVFDTWAVLDNVIPDSIHAADGWLITGSRFGVYENHSWITKLEVFLRDAYAAAVPIVGICFGHQILAQALGGKVEKFSAGWSVGRVEYEIEDQNEAAVLAFHQDQVIELPVDARVTGSTPFCNYAFLAYGGSAITMQPHPEFTHAFLQDLLVARNKVLPHNILQQAQDEEVLPLATKRLANQISRFFTDAFAPHRRTGDRSTHE